MRGILRRFFDAGIQPEMEPATIAKVAGCLYACSAAISIVAIVLPHELLNTGGELAMIGAWIAGASILFAARRSLRPAHLKLAALVGVVIVCVQLYYSGVVSGVYSAPLLFLILYSAVFFSRRVSLAQLYFTLGAYGVTLALTGSSIGFSSATRWITTALIQSILYAAAVWVVSRQGRVEADLRGEIRVRERLEAELRHLADHDVLTGIANRRRLVEAAGVEIARAQRYDRALSVALLDLDGFKRYNDRVGHAAGDQLLRNVTLGWNRVIRSEDLIARIGGDEFVALFPETEVDEASEVLQRMQESMPEGQGVSMGLVALMPNDTLDALLARADEALYEAKRTGGDRISVAIDARGGGAAAEQLA